MYSIELEIMPRAPVPLELAIGGGGGASEWYEGPYDATPKIAEQTLPTALKSMRYDVTVHGIPWWETGNPYGKTFVIGE